MTYLLLHADGNKSLTTNKAKMFNTDETYLEAFIDSIPTLPRVLQRNLELIRELDVSSSLLMMKLRQAEDDYLRSAELKLLSLPLSKKQRFDSDESSQDEVSRMIDPDEGVVVVKENGDSELVVPTTEELRELVSDPSLTLIAQYRADIRQRLEEKSTVAEHTYSLVMETISKLDHDIESLESILKINNVGIEQFDLVSRTKPDTLVAIRPNSVDWILAKVLTHDPTTGMYTLSDEDADSNKVFVLPKSQVVILTGNEKLSKGDAVFAVYPDTTALYQATVNNVPKRTNSSGETMVIVQFKDDGDEFGITHEKAVPLKYIMKL